MKNEEAIESFKCSNEQAKLRLEVEKTRMDISKVKELEFYIERDDMAIKALEQEPCEDAISRQAVLDLIADYDLSMGQVVKGIHALPPVTPQQKVGRWIESKGCDDIDHFYVCSECGRYIKLNCGEKLSDYPYCHCGRKMQESEDKK